MIRKTSFKDSNSNNPVPGWDADGLLPVVHPVTFEQSPYKITSEQLVLAMGATPERRQLLRGWLALRRELYAIGLVDGWQWINGSFVENIEVSEDRPPNDIDVTTFVRFPQNVGMSFVNKHIRLLETRSTKDEFGVDAYYEDLENTPPSVLQRKINNWKTWWSHTLLNEEKGFIEVLLSPNDDQKALETLNLMEVRSCT